MKTLKNTSLCGSSLSSGLVQGFAAWLLESRYKSLLEGGLHLVQTSRLNSQFGQQIDLLIINR